MKPTIQDTTFKQKITIFTIEHVSKMKQKIETNKKWVLWNFPFKKYEFQGRWRCCNWCFCEKNDVVVEACNTRQNTITKQEKNFIKQNTTQSSKAWI
jgi:hypothetical protein